jgi:hypothetical protein
VRIETFEQLINVVLADSFRFQKPTNAKPQNTLCGICGHDALKNKQTITSADNIFE